ncbi:unnamed protein product [Brassica napus]|uniref:(rape) hypothetical protein n=1 Tax=Brassica napus TaxID=3708 RepID=A0A816SH38_BRANA|nr:unnamed protein product [Brassica napus]
MLRDTLLKVILHRSTLKLPSKSNKLVCSKDVWLRSAVAVSWMLVSDRRIYQFNDFFFYYMQ